MKPAASKRYRDIWSLADPVGFDRIAATGCKFRKQNGLHKPSLQKKRARTRQAGSGDSQRKAAPSFSTDPSGVIYPGARSNGTGNKIQKN